MSRVEMGEIIDYSATYRAREVWQREQMAGVADQIEMDAAQLEQRAAQMRQAAATIRTLQPRHV